MNPATGQPYLISEMGPGQIWSAYIRYIGAGAVLAAGLITLARTIPTILSSAVGGLKSLGVSGTREQLRTEREIPMGVVLIGTLLLALFLAVAPGMPLQGNVLAAALIVIFGFFFSTVSSRITGLIGSSSNPISGMTIATLILTCVLFVALGWTGDRYAPIALCVGAVVCIAAANAGNTSQDLKTGYIVGATPLYQQLGLVIGVLTSALVIGMTTLYLHRVFGIGSQAIAAPQATLMATIIKGLLSQNLPWGLVLVGVFIAITLELCGIHSLSFAVGAYLPIATTAPIFVGGLVRWWVEYRYERARGIRARRRHPVQFRVDCGRLDLRNSVRGARGHQYDRSVSGRRRYRSVVPRRERTRPASERSAVPVAGCHHRARGEKKNLACQACRRSRFVF